MGIGHGSQREQSMCVRTFTARKAGVLGVGDSWDSVEQGGINALGSLFFIINAFTCTPSQLLQSSLLALNRSHNPARMFTCPKFEIPDALPCTRRLQNMLASPFLSQRSNHESLNSPTSHP